MSGDGLGDATRGNGGEVGRAADRDAVIADAQGLRSGGADQVEDDSYLLVASEIGLPADNRGTFQHVTGAVRRPRLVDVVVSANTSTPAVRSISIGGMVSPPAP
jgi:hypothetical protein